VFNSSADAVLYTSSVQF